MTTWIFYTDESYDDQYFCLSAIGIKDRHWTESFKLVRAHREQLKQEHGILLSKEIHAHKFSSGRGRPSDRELSKHARSRIFNGCLRLVSSLPEVLIFNICLKQEGRMDAQMVAWDRLMNRVERTMREFDSQESKVRNALIQSINSKLEPEQAEKIAIRLNAWRARAIIFADQGRELDIEKAIRRMRRHNYVSSSFGAWGDGSQAKNIPLERIIEDPIFKKSDRSYFIQLVDCVAFSLLRREAPTEKLMKYGYHKMFEDALGNVCFKKASPRDPLGIVRG
jgi:Protein of unknown function (DUF3800)